MKTNTEVLLELLELCHSGDIDGDNIVIPKAKVGEWACNNLATIISALDKN